MRRAALLAGTALLAGCAAKVASPPATPAAPPVAVPTPLPPPAPPPTPPGWEDAALASGDWTYEGAGSTPRALYGELGTTRFTFQCDLASHRVLLARPDAAAERELTLRTSYGARALPMAEGRVALPATDPFLDGIVASRGRFAIEARDLPTLVLPTWPEPARVLEDCR
jgi:hypothetical protein